MDGDDENEELVEESKRGDVKITTTEAKSLWSQVLSTSFVCVLIVSLSFIFVNLVAVALQLLFEGRRSYSVRQLHRAVFDYYKQQLYLWYLMIRNWNCHEDGKIKVIMPNYLAS